MRSLFIVIVKFFGLWAFYIWIHTLLNTLSIYTDYHDYAELSEYGYMIANDIVSLLITLLFVMLLLFKTEEIASIVKLKDNVDKFIDLNEFNLLKIGIMLIGMLFFLSFILATFSVDPGASLIQRLIFSENLKPIQYFTISIRILLNIIPILMILKADKITRIILRSDKIEE